MEYVHRLERLCYVYAGLLLMGREAPKRSERSNCSHFRAFDLSDLFYNNKTSVYCSSALPAFFVNERVANGSASPSPPPAPRPKPKKTQALLAVANCPASFSPLTQSVAGRYERAAVRSARNAMHGHP